MTWNTVLLQFSSVPPPGCPQYNHGFMLIIPVWLARRQPVMLLRTEACQFVRETGWPESAAGTDIKWGDS